MVLLYKKALVLKMTKNYKKADEIYNKHKHEFR